MMKSMKLQVKIINEALPKFQLLLPTKKNISTRKISWRINASTGYSIIGTI